MRGSSPGARVTDAAAPSTPSNRSVVDVLGLHLVGAFRVSRAAWPHMAKKRRGNIVLATSQTAFYGKIDSVSYCAAIPVISGYCGLTTHGGSEGVGSATTRAVINSALAVIVLGLEWHTPDFWGWDWNREAYPDPEGFFRWAHSKNVQVAGNVHPKYILSSDTHFTPFVQASGTESKVEPVRPEFFAMGLVKSPADRCVEVNLGHKTVAQVYKQVCLET